MTASSPRPDVETKRCTKCGEAKPLEEFYRDGVKNGRRAQCKTCVRARTGEHYARSGRASFLRVRFGITPEQYDAMLAVQGGACAICGHEPLPEEKRLRVDHDHASGRVRGLLCHSCNVALGHLRDDVALLAKAIAYLEHSRQSADA